MISDFPYAAAHYDFVKENKYMRGCARTPCIASGTPTVAVAEASAARYIQRLEEEVTILSQQCDTACQLLYRAVLAQDVSGILAEECKLRGRLMEEENASRSNVLWLYIYVASVVRRAAPPSSLKNVEGAQEDRAREEDEERRKTFALDLKSLPDRVAQSLHGPLREGNERIAGLVGAVPKKVCTAILAAERESFRAIHDSSGAQQELMSTGFRTVQKQLSSVGERMDELIAELGSLRKSTGEGRRATEEAQASVASLQAAARSVEDSSQLVGEIIKKFQQLYEKQREGQRLRADEGAAPSLVTQSTKKVVSPALTTSLADDPERLETALEPAYKAIGALKSLMSYYISASQNQQTLAEQEMEAVQEASTVYLGAQWKRALAEKDTEIQRLRGEVAKLEKAQARAKAHDGDASESALVAEKDAEIQRLRGEVAKLEKAQARAKAHDGGDASESALVAEKDAEIQRLRGEVAKLEKVQAVVAERENFIKAQRSREAKLTTELQRLRDEFAKLKGGRLPSKEEAMAVAEQVAGGVSARGEHAPPPCSSPPEAVGDAPSISEMYEKFSKPFIPPNVLKAPPVQLETIDKLRRDALRLGARPASRRKPEEKGKPASVVELPSVPTEEHKALEEVPPGDARGRGTVTPPPTSGAAKLVPGAAPLARSTPPKAPSDSSSAKDGTPAVEDAAVGEQANRQVGVSLSSGVVLTVRRLNKSESTLDDSSSTEEEPNKCVSPKGAVGIASKTSKDGEKAKEVAGAGKLEIRQLKRDLSSSSPSDGSYSTESVTPVKRVDHPRKSKPPPSENSFDKTTDDEPEELSKPVQKRASSPTAKPADSKSAVAKSKGNPPSGTAGEKKRATKKETKQPSAKGNAFDSSDTAASSITLTL